MNKGITKLRQPSKHIQMDIHKAARKHMILSINTQGRKEMHGTHVRSNMYAYKQTFIYTNTMHTRLYTDKHKGMTHN